MFPRFGLKAKPQAPKPNRVARTSYYKGMHEASQPKSPFSKKVSTIPTSKKITKVIDWVLVIAVIFCFIYSLIVRPQPHVLATSTSFHSLSTYQDFAAKNLGSIKDSNKITFNETALVDSMQKQFPEISSMWVELPIFGQKPIIHLTISQPTFVYSSKNVSYILDSEGVIAGTQADMASMKGLPTVIDQSNIDFKVGDKVISSDSVDFISQVVAQAKKAKAPISNIVLPAIAQEIHLRTTDKPYYVKFYFGNDVLVQTGQWLAARHEFDAKGITPGEYLDVRVPGKVFYK